jgi:hypothetical protein
MSFLAEAQKQKRLSDEVESSDGMTLLNGWMDGSRWFYSGLNHYTMPNRGVLRVGRAPLRM